MATSTPDERIGGVLNALARGATELTTGEARAAIFIVDPNRSCLRFVRGLGMPEGYTRAVDRFAVNESAPSCGRVVYTGRTVIVDDVTADERWKPFLGLAKQYDIASCWSFPVLATDGTVIGTFALYHREKRQPGSDDYRQMEHLASLASVVIQRHVEETSASDPEQEVPEFDPADAGPPI